MADLDLADSPEAAGVAAALEQLERELVGLRPVKRRIRRSRRCCWWTSFVATPG